jgi:hypothetical protein
LRNIAQAALNGWAIGTDIDPTRIINRLAIIFPSIAWRHSDPLEYALAELFVILLIKAREIPHLLTLESFHS